MIKTTTARICKWTNEKVNSKGSFHNSIDICSVKPMWKLWPITDINIAVMADTDISI